MATQKGRNWSSGDIVTAANLKSIERGVSAMAEEYTPTTWANGNTVTAAALNNIEQGIANAGSSWVTLTDESVTTVIEDDNLFARGELVYSGRITADTIKVTFNGVEYTVPVFVDTLPFGTVYLYGAQYSSESNNYDFSVYPFSIQSIQSMQGDNALNNIFTETAGTYSIKIEALQESGSSDFSTATVTVVTNDSFRLSNSVIIDETDDAMITNIFFESGDYPLVLYKGEYEGSIQAPDEMSITSATGSGGVSIGTTPFGYSVTITGDGTLNVTVE